MITVKPQNAFLKEDRELIIEEIITLFDDLEHRALLYVDGVAVATVDGSVEKVAYLQLLLDTLLYDNLGLADWGMVSRLGEAGISVLFTTRSARAPGGAVASCNKVTVYFG